jgi:cytochrome bd ubiquinol oxidase subunit II
VLVFMGLVSTWLPFLRSEIMTRWFEGTNFLWLCPVPLLVLANAVLLWRSVDRTPEHRPFVHAIGFFLLGFLGLVIGLWPNLIPPDLSIYSAAAPSGSQGFVLVGVILILPAVLAYTWWSYTIFRGKVTADTAYH